MKQILNFWNNDAGNATIDWVVLMAGIVSLGMAVGTAVSSNATDVADDINVVMEEMEPQ